MGRAGLCCVHDRYRNSRTLECRAGGRSHRSAAEALAAEGIECEVIDPRTIYPFDYDTVLASLEKTGRLVVVHEANRRSNIGGEIVSQVAERGFGLLREPPRVVAGLDVPMPYNRALEALVIPDEARIIGSIRAVVGR